MQAVFATALLDPERGLPAGVMSPTADPAQRFAIYRNNVVYGILRALAAGFPATERIVGEEFFAAMARAYVLAHLPKSSVLLHYGEDFADFIAAFPPAREVPYLADVARLEFLRRSAFHAADGSTLGTGELSRLHPAELGSLRMQLHPACAILRSPHPVVTIWAMNSGLAPLREITDCAPEDVLVLRRGAGLDQAVVVQVLSPGAAVFIEALLAGTTVATATEMAFAEAPAFDIAGTLAAVFRDELVTKIGSSRDCQP